MSAREELFRSIFGAFADEDRANKLIDDLLHEEAEKIRGELDPSGNPMFLSDFDKGLTHGADLIDPYAKGE